MMIMIMQKAEIEPTFVEKMRRQRESVFGREKSPQKKKTKKQKNKNSPLKSLRGSAQVAARDK